MGHPGLMSSLPSAVRAAIGLAASIVDEAKTLPDKAIELPMLAVSRALQLSLRAQQHYAEMTARGDEILATRHVTDDAPPWATFDQPVVGDPGAGDPGAGDPGAQGPVAQDPVAQDPVAQDPVATEPDDAATLQPIDDQRTSRPRKTVRAPRNAAPSRFDAVGDQP